MSLERMSVKKGYYYVICAITLLMLMWGTMDVASSIISYMVFRPPEVTLESPTAPKGMQPEVKGAVEPFIDDYYQSRMIFDRLGDSIARILVAGALFAYFSFRLKEMERSEI